MANRHLSRSVVVQSLFELDFNDYQDDQISEIVARNADEFAPGIENVAFAIKLSKNILEHRSKIDKIITKAAPEWPILKISIIDRNILRLGLYELLFSDRNEVPPKVAINESIELAKVFGGESSSKFVNGVLGTVYKELGEPGKDDFSKKHINTVKMPKESLAGAVVYRQEKGKIFFAFVHDVFGFWTLSKGGLQEKEKAEEGVKREIKKEIGIDIKVKAELGGNEYIASDPKKGKIKKGVFYFLAETSDKELKLAVSGGLDDVGWFEMKDIADLKMYDDIRPIISKAIKLLANK